MVLPPEIFLERESDHVSGVLSLQVPFLQAPPLSLLQGDPDAHLCWPTRSPEHMWDVNVNALRFNNIKIPVPGSPWPQLKAGRHVWPADLAVQEASFHHCRKLPWPVLAYTARPARVLTIYSPLPSCPLRPRPLRSSLPSGPRIRPQAPSADLSPSVLCSPLCCSRELSSPTSHFPWPGASAGPSTPPLSYPSMSEPRLVFHTCLHVHAPHPGSRLQIHGASPLGLSGKATAPVFTFAKFKAPNRSSTLPPHPLLRIWPAAPHALSWCHLWPMGSHFQM